MDLYCAKLTVFAFLLILLVLSWCWFQWTYRILIQNASKLNSALPTYPLIGSAHYSIGGWDKVTDTIIDTIDKVTRKGIGACTFWLGPVPLIGVLGVEDVTKILKSSKVLQRGDDMKYFKILMGDGLLTAPVDIWKIKRRFMNPLFHPKNVNLIIPTINKNCHGLVEAMSSHVGQGPFDVMQLIFPTSVYSITGLIFGADSEVIQKSSKDVEAWVKLFKTFPDILFKRVLRIWLQFDFIFNFLYRKELKQLSDLKNTFSNEILTNFIGKRNKKRPQQNNKETDICHEHQDALSLPNIYEKMKANFPNIGDDNLWDEVVTLLGAGTDTVSVITSTCLLQMAKNQDMQEKLYQEIYLSIGNEEDITVQDLHKMPYLDQVCKETLRWASISPSLSRKTEHNLELSSCTIPAGSNFFLLFRSLLMNPSSYPDPKKYDPERFSTERVGEIDMNTFVPFGAGPRQCIGKYFAEIEMKLMVAHVLRRYRLSTTVDVCNLKRSLNLVLSIKEGYFISLDERTV